MAEYQFTSSILSRKIKIALSLVAFANITACTETISCNNYFESGSIVPQVYERAIRQGFSGSLLVRHQTEATVII